jgi:hypothetical protein
MNNAAVWNPRPDRHQRSWDGESTSPSSFEDSGADAPRVRSGYCIIESVKGGADNGVSENTAKQLGHAGCDQVSVGAPMTGVASSVLSMVCDNYDWTGQLVLGGVSASDSQPSLAAIFRSANPSAMQPASAGPPGDGSIRQLSSSSRASHVAVSGGVATAITTRSDWTPTWMAVPGDDGAK